MPEGVAYQGPLPEIDPQTGLREWDFAGLDTAGFQGGSEFLAGVVGEQGTIFTFDYDSLPERAAGEEILDEWATGLGNAPAALKQFEEDRRIDLEVAGGEKASLKERMVDWIESAGKDPADFGISSGGDPSVFIQSGQEMGGLIGMGLLGLAAYLLFGG